MGKSRYEGGISVMIWAGIVNQIITEPFKVDEGVKLNSANNCNLYIYKHFGGSACFSMKERSNFVRPIWHWLGWFLLF